MGIVGTLSHINGYIQPNSIPLSRWWICRNPAITENGKTILPPFLALPLQRVEEAYALLPPRSQIDDR